MILRKVVSATRWTSQHQETRRRRRQADTIEGSDVTEILPDVFGNNRGHLDFLDALSRERLKLPSAAGRLELSCPIGINVRQYNGSADVSRGEQLYPPAPLFASVHTADHFL